MMSAAYELVNDKPKFSSLLIGITFAVFLMMQMTAMFAGILNRAFSTVTNVCAAMWIMDPAVNTASSAIPMPDYVRDSVRSMDGVSYAVPLFMGGALVKLTNGNYQSVNVIGLDDSSLFGRPELEQGNIQDIYADNSFLMVNDAEFSKLGNPKIGTTFELNDHRGVIVGIARVAANGLNGVPTLYTTFNRAKEYLPTTRFTISYILVQPKSGAVVAGIKQQVAKLGYVAFTKDEFNKRITDYLDVITAQATLLTNQRTALNLQMEQLTASVQLIKALGGGWDVAHETTAAIP
jgi:putative ABC transport system permease protein